MPVGDTPHGMSRKQLEFQQKIARKLLNSNLILTHSDKEGCCEASAKEGQEGGRCDINAVLMSRRTNLRLPFAMARVSRRIHIESECMFGEL